MSIRIWNSMVVGLALVAMALAGSGCQTKVCDARGPSDMCEVHNAYMESVNLPYRHENLPTRAYIDARTKFFPHASPFLMSPDCPHCVFYVCDYCEHAEQEYLKAHPGSRE